MPGSSTSPTTPSNTLRLKRKASKGEPGKRLRTPQACLPCRKQKSKCDGVQPSCRSCRRLNRTCEWPESMSMRVDTDPYRLSETQNRLLLDTFFATPHLETVRLSIHKPSFESVEFENHPEFLRLAICTLSALYLKNETCISYFDGNSPLQVSERLVSRVRQLARDTSDQPTVKNIQANVILALRELVARAGYNAYIYVGFAIRMAHTLRLMKEYHHRHPPLEREIRRRCMWSCVIIDILVSTTFSRPSAVQTQWTYIQLPCSEVSFLFGEEKACPTLAQFVEHQPENPDLISYFIKAVDWLNTLAEHVRAWVVQDQSLNLDGDFSNPYETKLATWISQLPHRLLWSKENLRVFRLLGQGDLFVSFHMVLSHSLCLVPQLYLPYTGLSAVNPTVTLSDRQIDAIRKCLYHANQIAMMADVLYNGDDVDRDILQSPFASIAMMCAASINVWSMHSEGCVKAAASTPLSPSQTPDPTSHHNLPLFVQIFQSWEATWPLARACLETISFLEKLYDVAYSVTTAPLEEGSVSTETEVDLDRTAAVGSGIYEPLGGRFMLSRWTQVLLAVQSEPQAVKREHAQAQLRTLCQHMMLRSGIASVCSQENSLDDGYEDGYRESYDVLSFLDSTGAQDFGGLVGPIDGSAEAYGQLELNYIPDLPA